MRILTLALVLVALPVSASAMSINFSWGPTKKCFDSKSPPITLSVVPAGTKSLKFKIVDLNAIDYPHGGGKVAYTGQNKLPYGAFRYKGPCPPSRHTYQISVDALDAKGKKLASAKARQAFSK